MSYINDYIRVMATFNTLMNTKFFQCKGIVLQSDTASAYDSKTH